MYRKYAGRGSAPNQAPIKRQLNIMAPNSVVISMEKYSSRRSLVKCGGFQKSRLKIKEKKEGGNELQVRLLAAGVLGHSLRSLRHSVLRELSRQKKAHGSLDFPTGDRVLLVVVG